MQEIATVDGCVRRIHEWPVIRGRTWIYMDLRLPRALKEIRKNPIRHSDRGLTKRIGKRYGEAGGMELEWRPLLERKASGRLRRCKAKHASS